MSLLLSIISTSNHNCKKKISTLLISGVITGILLVRISYSKAVLFMGYEIMQVTAKGQLTIPVAIRKKLNIREDDYLKSISRAIPLSPSPIDKRTVPLSPLVSPISRPENPRCGAGPPGDPPAAPSPVPPSPFRHQGRSSLTPPCAQGRSPAPRRNR